MDVDVARFGGQHPFVTAQQTVDHRGIGLRAAHEEVDFGLRSIAGLADQLPRMGRIGVATVARGLFEVGGQEAPHHFGMGPLHVVAIEMKHFQRVFYQDRM